MPQAVYRADAILLIAAVIWGGGFVAQRLGMQHLGPLTYNAIRFALGAAVLIPLIWWQGRATARTCQHATQSERLRLTFKTTLRPGLIAGSILFIAVSLQQMGIVYTTAGKAGFITGLYVVLVPILGLFIGYRTRLLTWLGAACAVAGFYFLSVQSGFRINIGDALVLACAVGWAIHVLVIAHLAPRSDPIQLACVQFTLTAALSALAAIWFESATLPAIRAAAGAIFYGGVCSVGIAYTLQVVGQRHAPPAHAALLLSGEAVFAALGGALILDEALAPRELVGCALVLGGIILSQLRRNPPASAADPPGI